MFSYSKCNPIGKASILGDFLLARDDYRGDIRGQEPYTLFFEGAKDLRGDWEPIKQGMFGGNYDEYEGIYNKLEEYYEGRRMDWLQLSRY